MGWEFETIKILISFLLFFIGACGSTGDMRDTLVSRGASNASHAPADWDGRSIGGDWSSIAHKAIMNFGPDLLTQIPTDIDYYCARYRNLRSDERADFWVFLLSRLARLESNFESNKRYIENFKDSKGNLIVSRGLLQISIESANGYGCGIKKPEELHDPEININCAVKILNRWVGLKDAVVAEWDGSKWRGAARYWSPFRDQRKRENIANSTSSQSYCL